MTTKYQASSTHTDEYKQVYANWEKLLRGEVTKRCFNMTQFVTEEHEKYGSMWQKIVFGVMTAQPTTEAVKKDIWMLFAKDASRVAINRRRQNTNTQMKKRFKGKPSGVVIQEVLTCCSLCPTALSCYCHAKSCTRTLKPDPGSTSLMLS